MNQATQQQQQRLPTLFGLPLNQVEIIPQTHTVSEKEILDFATKYDPNPIHLDDSAAKKVGLPHKTCPGALTNAIACKLIVEFGQYADLPLAGLGYSYRLPKPVFAGDTLTCHNTKLDQRKSKSNPQRAIVTWRTDLVNQHGEIVYTLTSTDMIRTPPPTAFPPSKL